MPSFSSNCHYQTIIGSGALQAKLFGNPVRKFATTLETIETYDNDFFDVEYTEGFESSDNVVMILHGLESNTKGTLVTNFAQALLKRGFGCCLVSFRGCNGEDNRNLGAYHLGFTTDINQLTSMIHQRFPTKGIYLCGFSLGGNVILKFIGELGEEALKRNIRGAAVCCVPFDPVASQGKLDQGFNRQVYSMNFVNTLKKKAERQNQRYPNRIDMNIIAKVHKIGNFDQHYIVPIYGFQDKVDYYRQTGSKWWLSKIRVPVLAINARDDPFIEESSLPDENDIGPEAPVRLIYTTHGGHCGFYGRGGKPMESINESDGWLADELSAALSHICLNMNEYVIKLKKEEEEDMAKDGNIIQ